MSLFHMPRSHTFLAWPLPQWRVNLTGLSTYFVLAGLPPLLPGTSKYSVTTGARTPSELSFMVYGFPSCSEWNSHHLHFSFSFCILTRALKTAYFKITINNQVPPLLDGSRPRPAATLYPWLFEELGGMLCITSVPRPRHTVVSLFS